MGMGWIGWGMGMDKYGCHVGRMRFRAAGGVGVVWVSRGKDGIQGWWVWVCVALSSRRDGDGDGLVGIDT